MKCRLSYPNAGTPIHGSGPEGAAHTTWIDRAVRNLSLTSVKVLFLTRASHVYVWSATCCPSAPVGSTREVRIPGTPDTNRRGQPLIQILKQIIFPTQRLHSTLPLADWGQAYFGSDPIPKTSGYRTSFLTSKVNRKFSMMNQTNLNSMNVHQTQLTLKILKASSNLNST